MEFEQPKSALLSNKVAPVYHANHIRIGTFIGGPIVAGYLIAENYKAFGDDIKVKWAWTISVTVTIILFASIFFIPDDVKIPNVVFPLIYCWIAYYLVQRYQGAQLATHINSGEKVFGWGRVVLIGLIGCALTVAILFLVIFATGALVG